MANTTLRAYLNDLKALLEREALEEVIGHCRHIIQHFPKNIEAYRTLGSALLERGRHAEAADVFQRVLGAVPDDFTAHIGLGSAYEESNVGAAIWHLERALEQEPTHQALQNELSRLITVRDGAAPAAFNLTRGALARVYLKSQLYNQAIIELQGALQENKDRVDLAVLLARTLWMSGHPVEASEIALQLLRTYPDNVEANRIMAALWLATGRPSDAEPFIARLELLDPFLAWETLHPDGTPLPRDAFQLPRLQWDARTAAAMDSSLPDWVSSIGDVFEAQEEASPAFTSGVGPVVSPWADDAPAGSEAEYAPGASADGLPDWLNDVVEPPPEAPLVPASSPVADAFADYTPDWLNDEDAEQVTAASAPFGMGGVGQAESIEDALDWLNVGPAQPSSQGATDRLPPLDEYDMFSTPFPSEPVESVEPGEPVEVPPDFAVDAFSWLNTGPLSPQDTTPANAPPRSQPPPPRSRMPGETGPLTMLQPPTGPLGAPPPKPPPPPQPPMEPVEPPPIQPDEETLSWLQTGSLAAPDSEPAPSLDFTAFEADLTTAGSAPSWLDADDSAGNLGSGAGMGVADVSESEEADTGPMLETSAELLGDIEENADLWGAGPEAIESPGSAGDEGAPELDLTFDSGWLADLGAPTQKPSAPPAPEMTALPAADAAQSDLSLDFSAFAASLDELGQPADLGDVTAAMGGDWLTELGPAPGAGPGDQAPDLDLGAWTAGAPASDLPLDLAPGAEIPGWLNELRQAAQPADAVAPAGGSLAADSGGEAGAGFGEEISLESLDLGWLKGEPAHPEPASGASIADSDLGLGPLGDLFLDDEPEPLSSASAPASFDENTETPDILELSAPEPERSAEDTEMMAWMRQVGILQEQPPQEMQATAPQAPLPVDENLLAGIEEPPLKATAEPEPPASPGSPEGGVSEADVLAFLRDASAPGAGDLYARMNEEEAAAAELEMPAPTMPRAQAHVPEPSLAAPTPDVQEPVLEDDFLAAFEVGVSSAPKGNAADSDDWLSTLGRGSPSDEPLGDDWLSQISRRGAVTPMEEPPPVEPVAEEPPPAPAPEEDIPLWQRPGVTASLAQANAALDLFKPEEPLVSEDDIPAWMRDAADELLVSPTDSTPIAAQEESASRGLLNFTPQSDAPSRPRMDTGILEPDRTPEWLAALSMDENAVPEVEAEAADAKPDWMSVTATPEAEPEPGPSAGKPGAGTDWLDNVFQAEEGISDEAGDEVVAADIPSWMQDLGLKPPGTTSNVGRSAPPGPAPTPLEELDFSALGPDATDSQEMVGAGATGADESFDFLAGLGARSGGQDEQVAKAADLADTTNEAGAAEPPAESKPMSRFSFNKEPAWKRKRPGTDGAP